MKISREEKVLLGLIASTPRTLHYFIHENNTHPSTFLDALITKQSLDRMVVNGYLTEDNHRYVITIKGRQLLDAPGVATVKRIDWRHGTYRTGDGDIITAKRVGSMDYKKHSSVGF